MSQNNLTGRGILNDSPVYPITQLAQEVAVRFGFVTPLTSLILEVPNDDNATQTTSWNWLDSNS